MIKKKSKKEIVRYTSVFLVVCLLTQVIFPTAALALNSGNSQPEVGGYQPVDATDNVGLVNGKFNYTIPITSIPEFPMAMGYNAGAGMEQEASCFGLGFNSFSGAISRNLSGVPDDINGGKISYTYSNQTKWDVGATFTQNLAGVSLPVGETPLVTSTGLTASITAGYNNYSGMYGAVGIGINAAIGIGNNDFSAGAGIGASLVSDSRKDGVTFGAGAGLGIKSLTVHLQDQLASYGISKTMDGKGTKMQKGGFVVGAIGKSVFPTENKASNSTLSTLAYILPNKTGFNVKIDFPLNSAQTITGTYSQNKMGTGTIEKTAYGFEYLKNYKIKDRDNVADMTIEGEDSYSDDARNAPSYLQYDNFFVNTMGLGGSMRMYQEDYGLVARNYNREQFRKFGLLGINTNRREIYPWYSVNKEKVNKGIDIMALLKKKDKPEDKDFDNVLFDEKELADFSDRKFGDTKFKMRGDYAGEFDVSSNSYNDFDPNTYSLSYMNGTDDYNMLLFGVENGVPQYYPNIDYSSQQNYNTDKNNLERGTVIRKKTMGDLLNQFSAYGRITAPGSTTSAMDAFDFDQNILSHYEAVLDSAKNQNEYLSCSSQRLNIIQHFRSLQRSNDPQQIYFNDLIGSVEVQNTSGLKYYFGLPVFSKGNKSVQLRGKGKIAPVINSSGDDYHSFDERDRGKVETSEDYIYPYAWMLTAIVGDDYIDFDAIPGPSDGDIGYWVKFKYIKVADAFNWRVPYQGMNHFQGKYDTYNDDAYSVNYGAKEVYYLSEIESVNYKCKYQYQKRFDGISSKGKVSGSNFNPLMESNPGNEHALGDNSLFVVTQISLFKKHINGFNSDPINNVDIKPIKATRFYYDYSQCPKVLNNIGNSSVIISNVPYHNDKNNSLYNSQPIGTGKLTLRKVQHIAYDETGTETPLPSYQFEYFGDPTSQIPDYPPSVNTNAKYNPDYDKDIFDQWGNYYAGSKDMQTRPSSGPIVNYYTNYTECSKAAADENSKVYNLKKISLPSGGEMEIDYEAQSYGFVEDKTPYVMRHVTAISPGASGTNETILTIDITDIRELDPSADLSNAKTMNAAGELKPIISAGDETYGEIAFYKNTNTPDPAELYISSGKIKIISSGGFGSVSSSGGRYYQDIKVEPVHDGGFDDAQRPFIGDCRNYMYINSVESRSIREQLFVSCSNTTTIIQDYETLQNADFTTAINKIVTNVKASLSSAGQAQLQSHFNSCFGSPGTVIYPHFSYFRTNAYKAKYTGCAVKSIKLRDNFRYATDPDGNRHTHESNEYGTNYFYDLTEDGKGTSSGVTPIEPGGGESSVIDIYKTTGAGFVPGPGIMYSKSAVQNIYANAASSSTTTNDVISRDKGKTVYEFYTAKENDYHFRDHFHEGQTVNAPGPANGGFNMIGIFTFFVIKFKILNKIFKIKIPKIIPLIVHWKRKDSYFLKSYAFTDYQDIFGRPKSVIQKDATGNLIGEQKFTYYGASEPVDVYKGNFTPDTRVKKPGRMDQVWSESYLTKEARINYLLLLLNAYTERKFSYTNMKYTYLPPVLKKVESNFDGLETSTENKGFDYYTGTPLDVRSNDSYSNTKIVQTVPAYWQYADMGTADESMTNVNNEGKINNFTATSGTYMYLNTVDNSHVLGAGVVTWSKGNSFNTNSWHTIPYLLPKQNYISATSKNYTYTFKQGSEIENSYTSALHLSDKTNGKPIVRNKAIYKPYKGYTYESALTTTGNAGTFTSFTGFNYSALLMPPSWKLLSTNELYSENGVLVQSKDVLGKYAAQLMGHNFSNTIGAMSNTSWGAAIHEGAENNYNSTGRTDRLLEADRVKIQNAQIIKACDKQFRTLSMCLNGFPINSGIYSGSVITMQLPSTITYNTPVAQIAVNFLNSTGQTLSRTVIVKITDDKQFEMTTNLGESFDAFFVLPQGNNTYKLVFNPNIVTYVSLNNSLTASGYSAYCNSSEALPNCNFGCKTIHLPDNDCGLEVHTGEYAFKLEPGRIGTSYVIHPSYPASPTSINEYKRKYKAMVWVHTSSTDNTQLIVQIKDDMNPGSPATTTYSTSMATPYLTAGNWSLLRLDFDLSAITPTSSTKYAIVYMKNASTGGLSIYDDFRVLPYHAEMTNWVFDHKFNRVMSGLDNDNFASYSTYDSRGRAIESAIELQNDGKKTIQKFLYNDQKHN